MIEKLIRKRKESSSWKDSSKSIIVAQVVRRSTDWFTLFQPRKRESRLSSLLGIKTLVNFKVVPCALRLETF